MLSRQKLRVAFTILLGLGVLVVEREVGRGRRGGVKEGRSGRGEGGGSEGGLDEDGCPTLPVITVSKVGVQITSMDIKLYQNRRK